MPKQPATTFTDFITAAAAKIPDPALAQQFTATFGELIQNTPPEAQKFLDNGVLLHRDYSRIISEQRAEASQLQQQATALAQREQELQHLQANAVARSEYDQLQQQLAEIRNRAQWVDTLRTRLDEMDLTELVLDSDEVQQFRGLGQLASSATTPEDNQMPDPATPNGNGQQPPAGTPMPQWVNGQWYLPMTAPAAAQPQYQPVPAQPAAAAAPDFEALVNARVQAALGEVLPAALAQVYGASSQTALEMQGFAAEWEQLKGESIDPRQLNQEFVQSGKQFNDFLEDRFKLSEAREAKRTADFQSAVDAAAEQKLQQRLAEMTTAGSLRNGIPSNPGSTPLFDAIAARPNGLRQAYTSPGSTVPQQPLTPQAAPAATTVPQQQPATPPPNPADTTGLEAAAAALASGKFANSRFDPTRPMGAPGMA